MTATTTPATPRWTGAAMVLAGAIAIGFAPIGLRLSHFGPQATAFWRFAFALPLIGALTYGSGRRIARPTPLALIAGVFFGFDVAFWHLSLTMTSVANATFIVNLGNVAVGLLAWLVLKEKPARIWPLAVAIALAGALMLSRGAANASSGALAGDLLALLAGAMVGMYLFLTKIIRRSLPTLSALFWATLVEALVAAIASGVTHEALVPPDPGWLIIPALLALIAHVGGQGLITAGVGRTPAAVAGILLLVQPVAAALAAWPMFGETLTALQLAGAALILGGVWLAGRS